MKNGFLILSLIATGCTSNTLINSRPDGASVNIDGQDVGETPAQWSSTVWLGTQNLVRLSKTGYRDTTATIKADNWNVGKVVVSVLCFLPGILVSTEYRPSYEFTLKPEVADNSGIRAPVAPIRLKKENMGVQVAKTR